MKIFKNKLIVFILIILALVPSFSLFHPGFPLTHDGQDHVARIANFYQNLSEGNIIPRWAGSLNWGYGHPILEFLYPLPSYIASFFHFIGFSLVDSTKIVFGLGMILSFIFMYMWLSAFLNKSSAIFGAVLYTYAPYRFVDLYVRGDIGENLTFAFIPLVLFFIYRLNKGKNINNIVLGAIALAFLILSHNAISLMALPFIIFYAAYLVGKEEKMRKELIYYYTSILVLGFALSAFFWIPGLFEGKYTLRNIVTSGTYFKRFVNLKALLYGSWSYGISGQFTVQLGILHWISFLSSILLLAKFYIKRDKKNLIFSLGLIIYTLLAIFFMLPISNFIWQKIILLQNFQFPWRFLAVTVFATSVLGAIVAGQIPQKFRIWLTIFMIILLLFLSRDYMKPKSYLYKPESFYAGIYNSTTDTGESSPIWSVRFMERQPKFHLEIIEGKADIQELKRTSTFHLYNVNVFGKSRFVENTLYFPGWEVLVDGQKTSIEFQDSANRGLITFFVDQGKHKIELRFTETKLRFAANLISGVSFLIIFFWGIITKKGLWQRFR